MSHEWPFSYPGWTCAPGEEGDRKKGIDVSGESTPQWNVLSDNPKEQCANHHRSGGPAKEPSASEPETHGTHHQPKNDDEIEAAAQGTGQVADLRNNPGERMWLGSRGHRSRHCRERVGVTTVPEVSRGKTLQHRAERQHDAQAAQREPRELLGKICR